MSERRNSKLKNSRILGLSPIAVIVLAMLTTAAAAFALVPSSTPNVQDEEKKVELIKISSTGLTPAQITRSAGAFAFTIDNESGIEEITLYVERADGQRVREIAIPRGVHNWGADVDLPAGSYMLKEANHPQWSCQITIQ